MSKLNLNPMADWGYVNNSRFRFLSIRNQGGGVEPEPPEPTNRILYTVVEGGSKPESTWITENCSENEFDENTGEGYLVLNEGVTSIGNDAFSGCKGLMSVTIPDSVTSIGKFAFSGCSGLTAINIPDSVTEIGDSAFSDCSGLTTVTIGNSVTSIGYSAFSGCSSLTSVTCLAINPPTLGSENFGEVKNNTLYVPAESVSIYQSDSNWNTAFDGNIQAIPTK